MKEITKALISFQSELKSIEKDAVNPHFQKQYLTLAGIFDFILPLLTKNELAVIQPISFDDKDHIITTQVIHSSGELIESKMVLPTVADPQKFGSMITYYKRYQLQALLGISSADEDDDGNSVSSAKSNYNKNNGHKKQEQKNSNNESDIKMASEKQINLIKGLARNLESREPDYTKLTLDQAKICIDKLNKGEKL